MAKKKVEETEQVLDLNATVQGSIVFEEAVNLRISGDFQGDLKTRGTLTIGEKANVVANIIGDHIIIAGKIKGNIVAQGSLTAVAPAKIEGDVVTPSLSVSEGAVIDGHLSMSSDGASQRLLSLQEVARYLEVEDKVLQEWAKQKKIPAVQKDNSWFFKKSEVEAWIQREKVQV